MDPRSVIDETMSLARSSRIRSMSAAAIPVAGSLRCNMYEYLVCNLAFYQDVAAILSQNLITNL